MLLSFLIFSFFFLLFKPRVGQLNCGLFGMMSTHLSTQEVNILHPMSWLTCFRGIDSTGLALVTKDKKDFQVAVHKGVLTPPAMISSNFIQKKFEEHQGKITAIVGHSRAATQGSITKDNAHPFRVDHIIGAHNGSINGLVEGKVDKTDSEVLFGILAKEGLQAAVDKAKYGAYALTWIDQRDGTLNFIRNSQRPLWIAHSHGTMYWMSEKWMLEVLQNKTHMSNHIAPVEVEVHTHYKYKLGQPNTVTKVEVTPTYVYVPSTTPIQGHRFKSSVPSVPSKGLSTDKPSRYPYTKDVSPVTHTVVPMLPGPQSSVLSKSAMLVKYAGPYDQTYDRDKADELLGEGCLNCNYKPSIHEDIHWLREKDNKSEPTFFCAGCHDAGHHKVWTASDIDLVKGGPIYAN